MLKCIITLYEESQRAIAESPPEKKVTWGFIKTTLGDGVIQKVVEAKFLDPKLPDSEIKAFYDVIVKQIEEAFVSITD